MPEPMWIDVAVLRAAGLGTADGKPVTNAAALIGPATLLTRSRVLRGGVKLAVPGDAKPAFLIGARR